MINLKDISFCIHGKIIKSVTLKVLRSIRTYYPGAQIILSIEEGVDTSEIYEFCDEIVETKAKKEYFLNEWFHLDNSPKNKRFTLNKQRNEVYNGLLHVKTKYAVKSRSDLIFTSNCLISEYCRNSKIMRYRDQNYTLFRERVLVGKFITGTRKFPFFVSDIFAFGLTEDLLRLYNGSLMTYSDLTFFRREENRNRPNPWNYSTRYSCEQQLWIGALKFCKANIEIPNSCYEVTDSQCKLNMLYLVNNLIVLDFPEIGIKSKFGNHKWGIGRYNFFKLYKSFTQRFSLRLFLYLFFYRIKNIFSKNEEIS